MHGSARRKARRDGDEKKLGTANDTGRSKGVKDLSTGKDVHSSGKKRNGRLVQSGRKVSVDFRLARRAVESATESFRPAQRKILQIEN